MKTQNKSCRECLVIPKFDDKQWAGPEAELIPEDRRTHTETTLS